jgi:hypothetical protein
MLRVRFHLANGPHFRHWQLKQIETGRVIFVDPKDTVLLFRNCTLKNQETVAKKIFNGENKTVCAWFTCDWSRKLPSHPALGDEIMYNPKKCTYWTNLRGENLDNSFYPEIIAVESKLFLHKKEI